MIEEHMGFSTDNSSSHNSENQVDAIDMDIETPNEQEDYTFELDFNKKFQLYMQHKLSCNIEVIKLNLGFDQFRVLPSFELLKCIKDEAMPHANRLMFLKFPDIVNTLMKLRSYKGNIGDWTLQENELQSFEIDAGMIRSLSTEIIEGIQKMFEIRGDQQTFWLKFKEEAAQFKEKTLRVDYGDLLQATTDEGDKTFIPW